MAVLSFIRKMTSPLIFFYLSNVLYFNRIESFAIYASDNALRDKCIVVDILDQSEYGR